MSGTNSGQATIAGTYQGPNFNIPFLCPANVPADAKPYIQPIYTAFQNLINILIMNAGISARPTTLTLQSNDDPTAYLGNNVHRFYCQAIDAIPYGAPVCFIDYLNNLSATLAWGNSDSTLAQGFCSTVGGVEAGNVGEFIIGEGIILNAPGEVIPGSVYYLGQAQPGTYTNVQPTSGVIQPIAFGITTNSLLFKAFGGLDVATETIITVPVSQDYSFYTAELYSNSVVFQVTCQRTLTFAANAFGITLDSSAASSQVYSIKKNGTTIGTITVPASGISGTCSCPAFATLDGDDIRIIAPSTVDSHAAGCSAYGTGTRAPVQTTDQPQDFSFFSALIGPSTVVAQITAQRTLTFSVNAFSITLDTPTTATQVYKVYHTGAQIGTITIAAGITNGVSSIESFGAVLNDDIRILAPSSIDATAGGCRVSATCMRSS